jgi:ferredoxin
VLRIRLQPQGVVLESSGAERLLDCLDEHALDQIERDPAQIDATTFPVSCRGARCASCRVRVLHGAQHLQPAAADELDTLRLCGAAPEERLACQVTLRDTSGEIELAFTALTRGP